MQANNAKQDACTVHTHSKKLISSSNVDGIYSYKQLKYVERHDDDCLIFKERFIKISSNY